MKYVDYYAALGLPRDADLAQIKKAYRTLARQHHPDMSKAPDAEEKFKNAAAAYATAVHAARSAARTWRTVYVDLAQALRSLPN